MSLLFKADVRPVSRSNKENKYILFNKRSNRIELGYKISNTNCTQVEY